MSQDSNKNENTIKIDSKTLFWNRVQLIMVLIVFAAPLVGAWLFMEYGSKSFQSYGDIYQPVRQVDNLVLQGGVEPVQLDDYRRQWVFLVVAKDGCNQDCEFNLLKIRQLRAMQNQNMTRIRTVFLHTNMVPSIADDLVAKYSGIEGFAVAQQELEAWAKVLKHNSGDNAFQNDRIYIIDPAGNLVMSYPADADPSYMKKDIKRLLKVSQIG